MAIVTRAIKAPNPLDVTIGYPGWGLQNETLAYMPLPKSINDDPAAWKSEYRGDSLPKKSGVFIVNLQGILPYNQSELRVAELCYLPEKGRWLAVPVGYEVIAWMGFPRPYVN